MTKENKKPDKSDDEDVKSSKKREVRGQGIDLLFGGVTADKLATPDLELDDKPSIDDILPVDDSDFQFDITDDDIMDDVELPATMEKPPHDLELVSTIHADTGTIPDFATGKIDDIFSTSDDIPQAAMTPAADLSPEYSLNVTDFGDDIPQAAMTPAADLSPEYSLNATDFGDDIPQAAMTPAADLSPEYSLNATDFGDDIPQAAMTPAADLPPEYSLNVTDFGDDIPQAAMTPAADLPPEYSLNATDFGDDIPLATMAGVDDISTSALPEYPPTFSFSSPTPYSPPSVPEIEPTDLSFSIGISGITDEKNILPEDAQLGEPSSNILDIGEKEAVEEDLAINRKVTRYVGTERRRKLDEEIERLYDDVAEELSVNKDDTVFALKTLSKAQNIIFEEPHQYDEALLRVNVVKTMIKRKRHMREWSYSWGMFIFIYAIVWLAIFLTSAMFTEVINSGLESISSGGMNKSVVAMQAAWFSALSGGIGGVIGILYSLYWRVSIKQNFDRQYVMRYLVQPIMGFVLGGIIYFIVGSGFLITNFAANNTDFESVLAAPVVISLQIVLGFIAGFRQRAVFEMLDRVVQKMLPKNAKEPQTEPESVMPVTNKPTPEIETNSLDILPPTDSTFSSFEDTGS